MIRNEAVVTYLSGAPTFDSVTKQNLRIVGVPTGFRKACFPKRRWQRYRCITATLQYFYRPYIAITNHVLAEHCSSALLVRQAITEHIILYLPPLLMFPVKGKAILLQAWTGLRDPKGSAFQIPMFPVHSINIHLTIIIMHTSRSSLRQDFPLFTHQISMYFYFLE
jgi:hypothetical protein